MTMCATSSKPTGKPPRLKIKICSFVLETIK